MNLLKGNKIYASPIRVEASGKDEKGNTWTIVAPNARLMEINTESNYEDVITDWSVYEPSRFLNSQTVTMSFTLDQISDESLYIMTGQALGLREVSGYAALDLLRKALR